MGIDDQHPAILRVLALERKLHSEPNREGTRMLSLADCTDARQAVEAARHTLPAIACPTLRHRVGQIGPWLAQQVR